MKLVHPRIDKQVDFNICGIYSLIIENPKEYFLLLNELVAQQNGNEGNWILSDVDEINISKSLLVFYDYFNIDFKSKKIESLMKSTILQVAKDGDFLEQLSKINKEIISLNNDLMSNINLPLMVNEDVTFEDVYKISNYSIDATGSLIELIETYIDIFIKLSNMQVVVFVNIFSFLSSDEINALIKDLQYKDIKIIFVDSKDFELSCEHKKIIIDKDLCII